MKNNEYVFRSWYEFNYDYIKRFLTRFYRIFLLVIFVICCPYFASIGLSQVRISTDFENGSMGSLKEIEENHFSGQSMHWIKKDKIGNQYYWFYFQVTHVKNKTLSFDLKNMTGIYRGQTHEIFTSYVQPVLSYDNKNWERIKDVSYDEKLKDFSFKVKFEHDTAWIAYAHPYTLSHERELIKSISGNPNINIESIGKSVEGRDMNMITITDPSKNNSEKKVVMITALQHSGEDCSAYLVEGLIKELLTDKPEIKNIRKKFIFKLIPIMNPDGIFHGITRYNWNMEDLNSEWDDDISDTLNLPVEPEVESVKKWVKEWFLKDNKIDMFLDVHSHTQMGKVNELFFIDDQLGVLLNNYWPIKSTIREFKANGGGSTGFFSGYKVPSGLFELTQSLVEENPEKYLDINDYLFYGKGLVYSLNEYFWGK